MLLKRIKRKLKIGSKPDFLIIGAQKSGTTSLYNYLVEYGENFSPARNKELYFFTENYDTGFNNYHANFPAFKRDNITGEATPDYLFFHKTPRLVFEYNPNLKIVIILRDPTKRAFSQYAHQNYTNKTRACDPFSFSDAIRKEELRYHIDANTKYYYEYKYFSYKKRGIYIEQINNWLRFFPKEQIHILFLEELKQDLETNLISLMDFLKITKNSHKIQNKIYNTGLKINMNDQDKEFLNEFYRPYNEELFTLLEKPNIWL